MQIYMIRNLETNLCYIGKDQNDNDTYMGSGLLLWNSYRKRFNRDDLRSDLRSHHKWVYEQNKQLHYYEKTILHKCNDAKELCKMERYYIELYNTIRPNGYNIAIGGEGGNLVAGYTEEERSALNEKISQKTKEAMAKPEVREKFINAVRNKDDEWIANISKSLTGRPGRPITAELKERLREINIGNKYGLGNKSRTGYTNSPEMNHKISEGLKKVPHTKEWNTKVSISLKGKKKSEEHKAALRKPKPKYKWLLPDGSIRIMDKGNGSKHNDWVMLEAV